MIEVVFRKFVFLLLVTYIFQISSTSANVLVSVNKGCDDAYVNCALPWVIEDNNVQSSSKTTEYHHLWGAVGAPSLLVAETPVNTTVSVNWTAFANNIANSITFNKAPLNIFGIAITELILYDDPEDKGSIAGINSTAQIHIPASLFQWSYNILAPLNDTSKAMVEFRSVSLNGTQLDNDTAVVIKVTNTGYETRNSENPSLLAGPGAITIDIALEHLLLNVSNPHPSSGGFRYHNHVRIAPVSDFTAPRYAVRLVMMSNEQNAPIGDGYEHSWLRSLNDEYAPGVFQVNEITTPLARAAKEGGYLQWRPVCYLTRERDVNKATLPNLSIPVNDSVGNDLHEFMKYVAVLADETTSSELAPLLDINSLKDSLAFAVFGQNLTTNLAAETVVSFGATDDGYYTNTNYTVWTFSLGSGAPPVEKLSSSVLIVIIVGLGLPALALLLSVVGFAVVKLVKRPQHHQVLQEEEGQEA